MKVVCQCGITFNNETSKLCPICSQGIIIKPKLENRRKREHEKTNIDTSDYKLYWRAYAHLKKVKAKKALWMKQARAKQKLELCKVVQIDI